MIYINSKYEYFCFENNYDQNHRLNGPAVVDNNNYQAWYKNGRLHRLNGPAVIDRNYKSWYIEDRQYTEHEYNKKLKEMGLEYDIY